MPGHSYVRLNREVVQVDTLVDTMKAVKVEVVERERHCRVSVVMEEVYTNVLLDCEQGGKDSDNLAAVVFFLYAIHASLVLPRVDQTFVVDSLVILLLQQNETQHSVLTKLTLLCVFLEVTSFLPQEFKVNVRRMTNLASSINVFLYLWGVANNCFVLLWCIEKSKYVTRAQQISYVRNFLNQIKCYVRMDIFYLLLLPCLFKRYTRPDTAIKNNR